MSATDGGWHAGPDADGFSGFAPLDDPGGAALVTAANDPEGTPVPARFVEWDGFWSKDRTAPEWLFEDVLARGRGHSVYAKHGLGKSLFALWLSTELVTAGHVVVYGDWEMGEDDLFDRLSDMGHGPETDLSRLRYLLLPDLPPLNSAEGARAFAAILDEVQSAWPDRHVAAIIDTIGRAVVGEENSNDTILGFYRHTGLELKRRGSTWVRLDHAGHDSTHARGGSAKGDDVDVVWQLAPTEHGIVLRNEKRRMSWVPEKVAFTIHTEPLLRYEQVAESWPAGTREAAADMDRLGVPLDTSTRAAMQSLKDADQGRRAQVVRAALRYRKMTVVEPDPPPDPPHGGTTGPTSGPTPQESHSYGADPPPDPPGPTPSEQVGPSGAPLRGTHVPAPPHAVINTGLLGLLLAAHDNPPVTPRAPGNAVVLNAQSAGTQAGQSTHAHIPESEVEVPPRSEDSPGYGREPW